MDRRAHFWRRLDAEHLVCFLCPHRCVLGVGDRGRCGVRRAEPHGLVTSAFGRVAGLALDPVEKKPLYHFFPGRSVLSFGTAGCNLSCRFCQNHHLSRAWETRGPAAEPVDLAEAAAAHGAVGVAFTYNDPVVFTELALEVAGECRARGLKTIAVTNGYISGSARRIFFAGMDAANVDLKANTELFYQELCGATLKPVQETLRYLAHETSVWLELTTLLIPGLNDSASDVQRLAAWVAEALGVDVPLHFSAFHPAFQLLDRPRTSSASVKAARALARAEGLRYVYTGNISDPEGGETICPGCEAVIIARQGLTVTRQALMGGACARCGTKIAGVGLDSLTAYEGKKRAP